MREIRTSGSEGGGAGYSTGPPYPYQDLSPFRVAATPACGVESHGRMTSLPRWGRLTPCVR